MPVKFASLCCQRPEAGPSGSNDYSIPGCGAGPSYAQMITPEGPCKDIGGMNGARGNTSCCIYCLCGSCCGVGLRLNTLLN